MRKPLLLFLLLCSWSLGVASGQCRLLDRATHLNPVPVVAEEFNYAMPGQVPQYAAGDYDPDTPANWGNSPDFIGRWGDGTNRLPTDWDAEPGRATTHYYSPEALEMTARGTLLLHATAISPAYPYRGTNPYANYRDIFYRTGRLVADPAHGSSVSRLLTYGLYEIRCKFPANPLASQRGLMPAFWLIGGTSELDVFDQVDGTNSARLNSAVIDWTNTPKTQAAGNIAVKHGPDLAAGFNVFSMLWTPDGVTFLLNDRAYYHVPDSVVQTHPGLMRLYLELRTTDLAISTGQEPQTSSSTALIDHTALEVDYIRVYSLKNSATAHAAYLTAQEYGHHNIVTHNGSLPGRQEYVSAAPGAIAVNPNDANELFFIGTDNLIYRAARPAATSSHWAAQVLAARGQGRHPAWRVASDLFYNPALKALVYRGVDNRIQQYEQQRPGGAWRHHYVSPKNEPSTTITAAPNCLSVVANGDIFFVAPDSIIHWYRREAAGGWVGYALPHLSTAIATLARGNLATAHRNGVTTVFYQGIDNQLQRFWWDADHYVHSAASPAGSPGVRPLPGAIVPTPTGNLFYIDQANGINQVAGVGEGPLTRLPVSALPAGNLAWDDVNQQLVYVDLQGGLQGYKPNATGPGISVQIDDYYPNTDQFRLFTAGSSASGSSSLAAGPAGDIFYRAHDAELHYFVREACDVFTAPVPGHTQSTLSRVPGHKPHGFPKRRYAVPGPGPAMHYSAPVRPPSTGTLVPLM